MPRVFTITSSLVGKASIMSRPTLCALVPGAVSSCTVIAEESAVTRHGSISKKTSGLLENARTAARVRLCARCFKSSSAVTTTATLPSNRLIADRAAR